MKKRFLSFVLVVAFILPLIFSLSACLSDAPSTSGTAPFEQSEEPTKETPTDSPEKIYPRISIHETSLYLFVGDTYQLHYDLKAGESNTDEIRWRSSSACASVEGGLITAKKEGYAYITANGSQPLLVNILPTQMPTLNVNTVDNRAITSKDTYVSCTVSLNTQNSDYCLSNLSAGIRLRGNSTASMPKKPYRIKFDSKTNILGMNGGNEFKSWVLLADFLDDSLIRTSTSLSLASAMLDEYSSDWRFVSLSLNGKYMGVYILCEQSQIAENRIDIKEAGAKTSSLDAGFLFEVDGSPPHDNKFKIYYEDLDIKNLLGDTYKWTSNDEGGRFLYISVKNDKLSDEQFQFAKKYLRNVFSIIYYATYDGTLYEFDKNYNLVLAPKGSTAMDVISKVVDVDSWAKMYIFSEMICNNDDLKKSFYLWVDFSKNGTGLLTFGCPWDFDGAIVAWNSYDYRPTDKYFAALRNAWFVMIMNHSWFVDLVKFHWEDMYSRNYGFSNAVSTIMKITNHYSEQLKKESELWGRSHNQREQALITEEWAKKRIEWLNLQFGYTPPSN